MTVAGKSVSYHKKFKFVVEIDGIPEARFVKAGPMEAEIAEIEQHGGGSLVGDKEPGRVKFTDITLEQGVTGNFDLYKWFKEVANVAANSGLITPNYKRNLDIVQQDRDGTTLRRWRIYEAWPKKFKAGDWDNDADENVMESVVLSLKYWEQVGA